MVMDRRTARFAVWRDLTITLWRLGPFTQLQVRDEVAVMFDMEQWEHAHPAGERAVGEYAEALSGHEG